MKSAEIRLLSFLHQIFSSKKVSTTDVFRMSTTTEKPEHSKKELAFVAGHDSKRFRLRAVQGEKEVSYTQYLGKRLAHGISWGQLILAIVVCILQIVTMSLATGYYSYDNAADCGGGIWSSLLFAITAIETIWCLKNAKYWKLHLSFALHICAMIAAIFFLIMELGGNIQYQRRRLGRSMFPDKNIYQNYDDYDSKVSVPLLITSIVLNSLMSAMTLVQLVSSFVMSVATGRAICCGQSKAGKVFELEIAGSENADGVAVFRKVCEGHHHKRDQGSIGQRGTLSSLAPPSYCETLSNA